MDMEDSTHCLLDLCVILHYEAIMIVLERLLLSVNPMRHVKGSPDSVLPTPGHDNSDLSIKLTLPLGVRISMTQTFQISLHLCTVECSCQAARKK